MISYDYYRIFYYVAQYKSFTKAAQMLDNNQPNITRCMNNLESEIGCKLFIRSNRGISLTPEGQRLYEHVAAGCEQFAAGECELAKDKGLERGLINIGASETALRLILLDKLETFHETYPHVRLKISNHSSPEAITALEMDLLILQLSPHLSLFLRTTTLNLYILSGSFLLVEPNTQTSHPECKACVTLTIFHLYVLEVIQLQETYISNSSLSTIFSFLLIWKQLQLTRCFLWLNTTLE